MEIIQFNLVILNYQPENTETFFFVLKLSIKTGLLAIAAVYIYVT